MSMETHIRAGRQNAVQLLYLLNVAFPTWGGIVAAIYVLVLSSGLSMAVRRMWES
jgi:hypothetical protein